MEKRRSVVILDFGGQYAHLIARRVRQCGVYSEIRDPMTPASELKDVAGIILSGGPQSVYDSKSPQGDLKIFDLGIPVLGICYGLQWMVHGLGGTVEQGKVKEYGRAKLRMKNACLPVRQDALRITKDLPAEFTVWMSHGDEAIKLPPGFERIGTSDDCKNAFIADASRNLYAVQFHPEVVHTEYGQKIIESFVALCDATPWSITSYVDHVGAEVQKIVGDRNVFMLVSGGVDSTVAFVLLNIVLGPERVQGLFVDTGLMRKDEAKEIDDAFKQLGIKNLRIEDASDEFFMNLAGVYDPEEKRNIIGRTFLDVQKRVSTQMGLHLEDGWMLGQGTIYPDTIETGETKNADRIKTHHNRIEEIQKMMEEGLVVEPLRDLYKDEVRILGEEMGLPHELVWRHPFPGPGLGVRILCAESELKIEDGKLKIDYGHTALPVLSVGVQGDGRSYRHALALFSDRKYPDDSAWHLATSIPNADKTFNRVLFCTSHASPPAIKFVPGCVTKKRADLLREADAIVLSFLRDADLYEKIWQFPVVLLPFGTEGGESLVLRPVESQEAMTASAVKLPRILLSAMTAMLLSLDGVDMVFLDMTNKPPGTIEWE